jgi:hypothetical protein
VIAARSPSFSQYAGRDWFGMRCVGLCIARCKSTQRLAEVICGMPITLGYRRLHPLALPSSSLRSRCTEYPRQCLCLIAMCGAAISHRAWTRPRPNSTQSRRAVHRRCRRAGGAGERSDPFGVRTSEARAGRSCHLRRTSEAGDLQHRTPHPFRRERPAAVGESPAVMRKSSLPCSVAR